MNSFAKKKILEIVISDIICLKDKNFNVSFLQLHFVLFFSAISTCRLPQRHCGYSVDLRNRASCVSAGARSSRLSFVKYTAPAKCN